MPACERRGTLPWMATSANGRNAMLERFTWFEQSAYLWRGDGIAVYIDP